MPATAETAASRIGRDTLVPLGVSAAIAVGAWSWGGAQAERLALIDAHLAELRAAVARIEHAQASSVSGEQFRLWSATLRSLNPSVNVPELPR